MNRHAQRITSVLSSAAALLLMTGGARAQTAGSPTPSEPATPAAHLTGVPQRDTLTRMSRALTISFSEHRLEDVLKFIGQATGADIEVFWSDDQHSIGLDKETPITLTFDKGSALDLLERVLDKAGTERTGMGNTWQLSESGTLQVGPKDRLNSFRSVKVYSIADLLVEIPNYDNAPDFDLQSVLQSQGSGGQSPFKDNTQTKVEKTPLPKRVEELQRILTSLIETEQWVDNGGNAASIQYFQGSFLVKAPDYIHRQIEEYPYWSRVARPAPASKRLGSAGESLESPPHQVQLAQGTPRRDEGLAVPRPMRSGVK